jgi:methionyl-tRNA formyltransferase
MRILMLGTGPFAVPTFQWLLDSAHTVPALVTRPTPPAKGREKQSLNPMRDLAEARGLEVFAPESINTDEARAALVAWKPDLLMVCDYGQILKPETLAVAPLGGINLHASMLPKYRGAAPIHWAILNGDAETGVTVIHMTPKLDAGPCLVVRTTPIETAETMPELEQRLARIGVEAVGAAISLLETWDRASPLGTPQDRALATKAPRLKKTDGAVDWSRSAPEIFNQVRALKPWPGTYTHWLRPQGEPLRLILDRVTPLAIATEGRSAGEVLASDGQQLLVATGGGVLALDAVQPSGKRVLEIAEFLRGYPVRLGDHFGG